MFGRCSISNMTYTWIFLSCSFSNEIMKGSLLGNFESFGKKLVLPTFPLDALVLMFSLLLSEVVKKRIFYATCVMHIYLLNCAQINVTCVQATYLVARCIKTLACSQ